MAHPGSPPPAMQPWTVERFFEGAAPAYALYQAVERMAGRLGPMEVRVSKSQVAFRRRRGFAYLWRPGMYVRSTVPLVLSLPLPRNTASPRFKEIVQPAPGIWMHHLELRDSSQLDDEVFQWMREAYEAAGRPATTSGRTGPLNAGDSSRSALLRDGFRAEPCGMNENSQEPRRIHLTGQPVAVVREKVRMDSLPGFFDRAFGAVMAAVQTQGAGPAGPPFALYRGMPTDTVDVEAGFPVSGLFTATGDVVAAALPETDAFEAIHTGPYDTLTTTYDAIRQSMEADGDVPADLMWEYYLSDPREQPDPATWQTRVVWPVQA